MHSLGTGCDALAIEQSVKEIATITQHPNFGQANFCTHQNSCRSHPFRSHFSTRTLCSIQLQYLLDSLEWNPSCVLIMRKPSQGQAMASGHSPRESQRDSTSVNVWPMEVDLSAIIRSRLRPNMLLHIPDPDNEPPEACSTEKVEEGGSSERAVGPKMRPRTDSNMPERMGL